MTDDDGADRTRRASARDVDAVVQRSGPTLVVEITGDLDAATTPRVLEVVTSAISEETTSVTLDCAGVRFCDSAGLGGLIRLSQDLPTGSPVVLRAPSPPLLRLVELTGSRSLFAIS